MRVNRLRFQLQPSDAAAVILKTIQTFAKPLCVGKRVSVALWCNMLIKQGRMQALSDYPSAAVFTAPVPSIILGAVFDPGTNGVGLLL